MVFHSPYNRPQTVGKENSGKSIVDTEGYISPKQRIENLILAGENLDDYRRSHYDFNDGYRGDDGETMDPLRDRGLDMADVSMMKEQAMANLQRQAGSGFSTPEAVPVENKPEQAPGVVNPGPEGQAGK